MSYSKLTSLSSLIITDDGADKVYDSLSSEEKEKVKHFFSVKINEAISNYYRENRNEWHVFFKTTDI